MPRSSPRHHTGTPRDLTPRDGTPRRHTGAARLTALMSLLLALALAVAAPASARVLDPSQRPGPGAGRTVPVPWGARAFGDPLPVAYAGPGRQLIVVRADCRTCTSATLQAWNVTAPGRGVPVTAPIRAKIGERGVGAAYENSLLTPLGTWDLPEAFGRRANPGTSMPYFVAGPADYWDDTPGRTYNSHVVSPSRPVGESLWAAGAVYDYAVVMGVNPGRVPGGGSGFFLHVTDGRPTLGCVAIGAGDLVAILRWLTPSARPQMMVTL